jgi:hypothetical protein
MTINKSNLNGKNVLFIAYFYPPVASTNVPGAMRTVKFIRHLANGKCHVLTTTPEIDENLSALNHLSLPVNNEIIHRIEKWDIFKLLLSLRAGIKHLFRREKKNINTNTSSPPVFKTATSDLNTNYGLLQKFKDFIHNLVYFPDQAGPWILPAYLKGKKIVREHNVDIIFATGSPWSDLVVGHLISKSTGIPLIADFRDPWVNNPFHHSKGKLLDRWSARLEKKVVECAAAVSLNTEPLMEEFRQRYPKVPSSHFFVMPNGFDMHDFEELKPANEKKADGILTFCHTGFLYGVRDPAVLLNAIKAANSTLTNQQKMIRFRQIGNIELGYNIKQRYASMIDDGSLVLEPPRPYKDCLQILSGADWVVNVQPATKSQIPSKLYDYLAINRPILNITPADGALGQIVTKYKLGELFGFNDEKELTQALIRIGQTYQGSTDFIGYPARKEFDCAVIAVQLAHKISLTAV